MKANLKNIFWPAIETQEEATKHCRYGMWLAVYQAVGTGLLAVLAMNSTERTPTTLDSPDNIINMAVYAGCALGLKKHSRAAALLALGWYVLSILIQWSTAAPPRGFLSVFLVSLFVACFVNAVRAAFTHHRLRETVQARREVEAVAPYQ